MVFPQDICYVVQFHWLKYDPLGYATYMLWRHWFQLEMTKMLHHCMCFWPLILCSWFLCPVLWESLLKGIKSIHIFQVCMLKLSPLSKFLHGRWRKKLWCLCFSEQKAVSTPPVQANFIQQSSPCSSYGPLTAGAAVGCRALAYISAPTIWNAKPLVTAIKCICQWWQYQWDPLPIVGCMALGYISAQTIWNAKPVVAAIQWICQWWQYQCDLLPIVRCMALEHILSQTMWNTKSIVAAIKLIFWLPQHHWALTVGSY